MGVVVAGTVWRGVSSDAKQIVDVIQGINEKDKSSSFIKVKDLQTASKKNQISTREIQGRDYSHF